MMRALTPRQPFQPLSTLHREIDDMFSRFFDEGEWWTPRTVEQPSMPSIEFFTRDGTIVVRADLPGIDPKNVELAVEGDRLVIKGERKQASESKGVDYLRREVTYGRFERTVALPPGVDPDSVKATYHDGVLEVTMKAPKGFTTRKVPITVH